MATTITYTAQVTNAGNLATSSIETRVQNAPLDTDH